MLNVHGLLAAPCRASSRDMSDFTVQASALQSIEGKPAARRGITVCSDPAAEQQMAQVCQAWHFLPHQQSGLLHAAHALLLDAVHHAAGS